ncbi:tape measure protein, partial [Enterobacter hormaechei]
VLSAQQFEDTKTAIQEQASNARKRIAQDEANSQMAATVSMLNAASLGFDSLAGIISGAAGKASSAYIAMFAAAKSFAIASATLDFNGALLKALNAPDSLTTAQRFANYAAVASAGASVLSNIASVSMSGGRRYGGTVSAGNAYRINEDGRSEIFQTAGGQQAFIPNQSGKIIPADKVGGGGGVVQHITFEINTTGGIDDATMAKMAQMMKQVSLNTIRDQQRPNGLLRR